MTSAYSKTLLLLPLLLSSVFPASAQEVLPERATAVVVSNRDVNRIHCNYGVTEVHWSKERPVSVEHQMNSDNVFVKFLVRRVGNHDTRVTEPVDLHIVCGGEVYTLILHPRDQDSTTVRLGDATRKQLQAAVKDWGAIPIEEQVKKLTLAVFRNELPNSLERQQIPSGDPRRNVEIFDNAQIVAQSEVRAPGTGLKAVEYIVIADEAMRLEERDFLVRELGDIVALTIDPLVVPKGGAARLIVIERSASHE